MATEKGRDSGQKPAGKERKPDDGEVPVKPESRKPTPPKLRVVKESVETDNTVNVRIPQPETEETTGNGETE